MEDELIKMLERAPELLAMVLIVGIFVGFLKFMIAAQGEKDKATSQAFTDLTDRYARMEERSNATREALGAAVQQNTLATDRLSASVNNACKFQVRQ